MPMFTRHCVVIVLISTAACGAPPAPSSTPVNVAGTWDNERQSGWHGKHSSDDIAVRDLTDGDLGIQVLQHQQQQRRDVGR